MKLLSRAALANTQLMRTFEVVPWADVEANGGFVTTVVAAGFVTTVVAAAKTA